MEYLFQFFGFWFELAGQAIEKLWDAAQARKKKAENTKTVNANEMKENDLIPESVRKKTAQDNMDISREDFAKLSKEEQQQYRQEWNSLPAEKKQERLNKFTQDQLPQLQQAYDDEVKKEIGKLPEMKELDRHGDMDLSEKEYKALSKEEKKQREAEWKNLPKEEKQKRIDAFEDRIDKERGKVMKEKWNDTFRKYHAEHGSVSLFKSPAMNVPKIVRDQMAYEQQDPRTGTRTAYPVSNEQWEKMNHTQRANFISSYSALSPEEKVGMMKAFQAQQQKKIARAWRYYSNVTGNIIKALPEGQQYAAYSTSAAMGINAMDQRIQKQKQQSQSERQKDELQTQKLDGNGKETELEQQEIEKNRQLNEAANPGQNPVPNTDVTQPDKNGVSQTFVPQAEVPKGTNLQQQVQQLQTQAQRQIDEAQNRQPTTAAQERLRPMQEHNVQPADVLKQSSQEQMSTGQGFGQQRRENNGSQLNSAQSFNQSMDKYGNGQQEPGKGERQTQQGQRSTVFSDVKESELDPDYERKQREIQEGAARRKGQAKQDLEERKKGLDKTDQPNMGVPTNFGNK